MPKKIHVIVNPAATQDEPVLHTLNTIFRAADAEWNVSVTQKIGDGQRLAEEAVDAGADVVAAYGGDGTVADVANGLVGSDVPLAILPGGTANVLAQEFNIPDDLEEAATLIVSDDSVVQPVDMGDAGGRRRFMLRLGVGLEAAMVEGADRELKNRVGTLAYVLSGLQALQDPPTTHYHLTIDGQDVESEGVTCIVANSGNVGIPGFSLKPAIDVSDGLLDVLVLRKADLDSLLALTVSVVSEAEIDETLQHWQAEEITVDTEPPQTIQCDGDDLGETPITAKVVPHAIRVIVPEERGESQQR